MHKIRVLFVVICQVLSSSADDNLLDRSHFRRLWSSGDALDPPRHASCPFPVHKSNAERNRARNDEERLRQRVRQFVRLSDGSILGDYGPLFLRRKARYDHRLRCTSCHAQVTNTVGMETLYSLLVAPFPPVAL